PVSSISLRPLRGSLPSDTGALLLDAAPARTAEFEAAFAEVSQHLDVDPDPAAVAVHALHRAQAVAAHVDPVAALHGRTGVPGTGVAGTGVPGTGGPGTGVPGTGAPGTGAPGPGPGPAGDRPPPLLRQGGGEPFGGGTAGIAAAAARRADVVEAE